MKTMITKIIAVGVTIWILLAYAVATFVPILFIPLLAVTAGGIIYGIGSWWEKPIK